MKTLQFTLEPGGMWTRVSGAGVSEFAEAVAAWGNELAHPSSGQPIALSLREEGELEVLSGVVAALRPEVASPIVTLEAVEPLLEWLRERELLRGYQAEAVSAALVAPFGRGILDVAMGGGKTRIAIAMAAVAAALGRPRWLYLVQNRELVDQTLRSLAELSEPLSEALGGPAVDFQATTYAGIRKLDTRVFDGVLVDECHGLPTPTRCLPYATVKAAWHIGLSGTPLDRQDAKNALTIGLLGPVRMSIDVAKLEAEGHLARGRVQVVRYSRRAGGLLLSESSRIRG